MTAVAIRPHAYAVWWSGMDRWVVPASALTGRTLSAGWTTAKVGELVQPVTDRVTTDPDTEYKMAGVKWYGHGVFHRETVRGDQMSAKYVAPLKSGALVYNRLFAWKASFAVVPNELSNCFVSNEFPQFITDPAKLLPEYLYLWSISEQTIRAVTAASTGSAAVSRNRFREDFFLEFDMPVPPMAVQREIVSAWEQAQAEVAYTRQRIAELEGKTESEFLADLGLTKPQPAKLPKVLAVQWHELERWSVMFNQLASVNVDISDGKYQVSSLGGVAAVSYGIQKSPANRPGEHARPYLRVANVQRGELDLREVKTINVPDAEMPGLRLEPGDLVVCEGNSADLVGRPAIWRGEIPNCVHQNHILKVRVDREQADPEYVLEYMQTTPARIHFRSRAKFTTNLASINSTDLRDMPLALPPLRIQRHLAARMAKQRQKIKTMKTEADCKTEQAKVEVEAMIRGERPGTAK